MEHATLPTGGGGNNPATKVLLESTGTPDANAPVVAQTAWSFSPTTDNHVLFAFIMPSFFVMGSYGPALVRLKFRMASATTGGVVWKSNFTIAGSDESLFYFPVAIVAAVPSILGFVAETALQLYTHNPGGTKEVLFIGRDADDGRDTAAGAAYLLAAAVEFDA
jgi:hypothetical protein